VELDDYPWGDTYYDERDRFETVRGGAGDDRIVGATTAYGDAGNDTLVAGWGFRSEMTGGSGADKFQFTDDYVWDTYKGDWWYDQRGRILDFAPREGDRIAIDRVDDSAAAPVFAGYVDNELDLEENEYGIVGENTFVLSVLKGTDWWYGDDYVVGVHVELPNFSEEFRAGDVLFV
jgi:hypothetical protein